MMKATSQKGFTLLEVLAATFIFSVSIIASYHIFSQSGQSLQKLEQRFFAQLAAHNQMAQLTLNNKKPKQSISNGNVEQGPYQFLWEQQVSTTENEDISRITLTISTEENQSLSTLVGFIGSTR